MNSEKHIIDLKKRIIALEVNSINDHNRIIWLYEKLEEIQKQTIGDTEYPEQLDHQNPHLDAVSSALQS